MIQDNFNIKYGNCIILSKGCRLSKGVHIGYVIQLDKGLIANEVGNMIKTYAEYANWFNGTKVDIRYQEDTKLIGKDEIPVGSIEWTEDVSGRQLKQYNIPHCMMRTPFTVYS